MAYFIIIYIWFTNRCIRSLLPLECWVIEATGSNGVKNTKLRSYYNEEFGFVLFEYENIDGSKVDIYLSEIKYN